MTLPLTISFSITIFLIMHYKMPVMRTIIYGTMVILPVGITGMTIQELTTFMDQIRIYQVQMV